MLRVSLSGYEAGLAEYPEYLEGGSILLTWGDIVIGLNGNILIDFHVVDILQDGQPMANTGNAHLFQFIVFESHKGFTLDTMLYAIWLGQYSSGCWRGRDKDTFESLAVLP